MEVGAPGLRDSAVRPTLSLSTSWCSSRHQDGYEMAKEMVSLGFSHIELSHGIRITLVPGLLRAFQEGMVKVSSTHNFCPLPMGVTQAAPNLFEPSSGDFREIDQWVRHTKRSIDFAAQVKARVLVCHLGSVRFFWGSPAKKLHDYLEKHPKAGLLEPDAKYTALAAKAVEKLRQRMTPYWQQTKTSLTKVFDYAAGKGVKLGLENREAFEELPLDGDYAEFVAALPVEAAGYWHDTGHADIKQTMGLLKHREHLEKNAPRLLGFHLHDVNAEGDDHQPIGAGQIDFNMVREFWKPEHLLVLELSPRVKVEDVVVSKQRLEALIG